MTAVLLAVPLSRKLGEEGGELKKVVKNLNVRNETKIFEPRHEKTCLRGFRPGKTQTGLRSH